MTAAGEAVLVLDLQEHMRDNPGAGQGGLIATLVDAAASQVALSRVDHARDAIMVDLHVSYLRAAAGDRLVATAHATGGGRSVCFCEVRVDDAQGQACAQAMATFRYRDRT